MTREEIEELTIAIITRLHERYENKTMDDADYIPLIKSVISGAIDFAEKSELSKEQQKRIKEETLNYARGIYIEGWLKSGDEAQDREQATQEGLDWYNYIYKNEKYP